MARSLVASSLRRRLGLVIRREFARHRIRRSTTARGTPVTTPMYGCALRRLFLVRFFILHPHLGRGDNHANLQGLPTFPPLAALAALAAGTPRCAPLTAHP